MDSHAKAHKVLALRPVVIGHDLAIPTPATGDFFRVKDMPWSVQAKGALILRARFRSGIVLRR